MSKTIGIAGLGWLGQSFAQQMTLLGYKVKGSVTSMDKATTLQKSGFNVFPLEISEQGIKGEVRGFLKELDSLVIMIPPGLRRNTGSDYVLKMTFLLEEIINASVAKVILVSSTSVYDDSQGAVTEKTAPRPTSEAGKQLLQVEQLYFNAAISTTIVRFGGLFGGSRQPARYLAGRKDLSNGDAPVNLIHRNDCVGILSEIIKRDAFGHIFNAVIPTHPLKRNYYVKKADELQLKPPSFTKNSEQEVFKKVDSINIKPILEYQFKVDL